jgi:hypothetical protein
MLRTIPRRESRIGGLRDFHVAPLIRMRTRAIHIANTAEKLIVKTNQFEWPLLFYVACLLPMHMSMGKNILLGLAWLFVVGRIAHSGVQILSDNIRLRGWPDLH